MFSKKILFDQTLFLPKMKWDYIDRIKISFRQKPLAEVYVFTTNFTCQKKIYSEDEKQTNKWNRKKAEGG